jgi:glycerophosphoryl diester phosphodiesterase
MQKGLARQAFCCLLAIVGACGSSGSEPIDPIAIEYCALCSELNSCERVVDETLKAPCPDETAAYYTCVTEASCDESACEAEWMARQLCAGSAPRDMVQETIAELAPSANIGHRGTGPTREGHPFPENSISSFEAAIADGADGIELDVEITMDGEIIVMHDDTLDRTTNCTGCVSAATFDEIRACRLLDGDGNPTDERPPTLAEVYAVIGGNALINVELKVFGPECETGTTGAEALVEAAVAEVVLIGGESRTLFSSFDETAAGLVKTDYPGLYSALLSLQPDQAFIETALDLEQDAIHPFFSISADDVTFALESGLQVNVWTVNTADLMQQQIDKGSTAIITDEPGILTDVLADQP